MDIIQAKITAKTLKNIFKETGRERAKPVRGKLTRRANAQTAHIQAQNYKNLVSYVS